MSSGGKRASLFSPRRDGKASGKLAPAPKAKAAVAAATPARPPSRQNKRVVSVYVEPEALRQLRAVALEEDTSVQALMVEAINDLFAKRGVNRIA